MWASTVLVLSTSRSQIAWLERPSAMAQHLTLACGESVQEALLTPAGEEAGDDLGIDDRLPLPDPPDGVRQLADVAHPVLEQVAEPVRAVLQELHREVGVHVLREHEHADVRMARPDRPCRPEPFVRVGRGHADVRHDHVGRVAVHHAQQRLRVAALANDLEPGHPPE